VILLYGFQWTYAEVASMLGVAKTTAQTHAERGLAHLRKELGVGK
jgi:DNA-directed RNA polymerase specialized sigma24 family protein